MTNLERLEEARKEAEELYLVWRLLILMLQSIMIRGG